MGLAPIGGGCERLADFCCDEGWGFSPIFPKDREEASVGKKLDVASNVAKDDLPSRYGSCRIPLGTKVLFQETTQARLFDL